MILLPMAMSLVVKGSSLAQAKFFALSATGATAIENVLTTMTIPEPSSYALLGGLLALSAVAMKRRNS